MSPSNPGFWSLFIVMSCVLHDCYFDFPVCFRGFIEENNLENRKQCQFLNAKTAFKLYFFFAHFI